MNKSYVRLSSAMHDNQMVRCFECEADFLKDIDLKDGEIFEVDYNKETKQIIFTSTNILN